MQTWCQCCASTSAAVMLPSLLAAWRGFERMCRLAGKGLAELPWLRLLGDSLGARCLACSLPLTHICSWLAV